MNLPANFAQRILDAARIAAALHQQSLEVGQSPRPVAGGAGAVVIDHDGRLSRDGTAPTARVR